MRITIVNMVPLQNIIYLTWIGSFAGVFPFIFLYNIIYISYRVMAIDGIGKIVTFVIELIPILAPLLLKYTCPSNLLLFLVYAILFIS